MTKPLEGIRVVEVAAWTFVPVSGAILADLGADVLKVEPPTGDPQRALQNMLNLDLAAANPFLEIPNRGKRSVTIDLRSDDGRDVLLRLAEKADVFVTSYLPAVRRKLRIDVGDVRAANPSIIYVRGTGWGSEGPMADVGGYDAAAAWATSGIAWRLTPPGGEPPGQPPAFFDLQGGNTIAGAIGMALLRRERFGEPSVVDVSLMNVGMWALGPDIMDALNRPDVPQLMNRAEAPNPIVNTYRTKDDRWISFVCLQGDRFWAEFCGVIERPDLVEDPRFESAVARYENRVECVRELDAVFATRVLAEWRKRFTGFSGVWAPVQSFREIHEHAQIEPNGYLPRTENQAGNPYRVVSSPMQFDREPTIPAGPAPEVGQHTEEVLLEAGASWEEIGSWREKGALG